MEQPLDLDHVITLEKIDVDLYRGQTPNRDMGRIFGGQVVAQALRAAYHTVEGRLCHSLHAYFIHPGDASVPILYQVERARDGRSFTTRRIRAIQHGRQIFNMAASFQVEETGFDHQFAMAEAPEPEGLQDFVTPSRPGEPPGPAFIGPVELKPASSPDTDGPTLVWFRAKAPLGDDQVVNQCALAYASDYSLLYASLRQHHVAWGTFEIQTASLDHALWFHRSVRFNDWHLYVQDSPSASGARGLGRGEVFSQNGVLVASAAQEGLIRPPRGKV